LAVVLFAILVTEGNRDRTGPAVDRRAVDLEAEGFLALRLDRGRSNGGAAGAVLAVEIGNLARGQRRAAERIEGHAAISLGNGVAADNLSGRVEHRVLRQVEARELAVGRTSATGEGGAVAADQRRARQRHIVDLDAGVGFAVLEVARPGP